MKRSSLAWQLARPRQPRNPWLLLSCAILLGQSCRSENERAQQAEVQAIVQLVNAVRDAPSNAKGAPLSKLKQAPCVTPQACTLKALCARAYTLHSKATAATLRLRQKLMTGAPLQKDEAARILALGEKELTQAKDLMSECVQRQGQLERETRP